MNTPETNITITNAADRDEAPSVPMTQSRWRSNAPTHTGSSGLLLFIFKRTPKGRHVDSTLLRVEEEGGLLVYICRDLTEINMLPQISLMISDKERGPEYSRMCKYVEQRINQINKMGKVRRLAGL
jgi:hypothetical protein